MAETTGHGSDSARPSVAPFPGFAEAAGAVLADLHLRVGLRLWLVTRLVGDHQVVLVARDDHGYGVTTGSVLSRSGSLCAAMVAGRAPAIVPRIADVPAYATAPNREHLAVEAYVGFPLVHPDGEVFGSLCAFDPEPQPAALHDAERLVRLQARLLSTVLQLELAGERLQRRAEQAESDATTDTLTSVGNRRGWETVLAAEEARCRRYGHEACVVVVDVDGLKGLNDTAGHFAGDRLLQRCADVLRGSARSSDYVARTGGDEFALLATETGLAGGLVEAERIRRRLTEVDIDASVGVAARAPQGSLEDAWRAADGDMYQRKAERGRR